MGIRVSKYNKIGKVLLVFIIGVFLLSIIPVFSPVYAVDIGDYLQTYNDFVKEHPSKAQPSDVLVLGDDQTDISKYALTWLGRWDLPYVWGGAGGRGKTLEETTKYIDDYDPYWGHIWIQTIYLGREEIVPTDNGIYYGTDCIGFCCACYQHFGFDVQELESMGKTWAQFTPIDDEELVPGDLVANQWDNSEREYAHANMYVGKDKSGNKYCINTDYATGWAGPEFGYIAENANGLGCHYANSGEEQNNIAFPWLIKMSDMGDHQSYRVVSDIDDLGDGSKVTLKGFNETGGTDEENSVRGVNPDVQRDDLIAINPDMSFGTDPEKLGEYNDYVKGEGQGGGAWDSTTLILDDQTDVSMYALTWLGRWDLPYVNGGYGGRGSTLEEAADILSDTSKFDPYWMGAFWLSGQNFSMYPSSNGIYWGTDCSGFCAGIYRGLGLGTIDSATSTMWGTFTEVSEEEAVPGDIVGSSGSGTYPYGHASIYVGKDENGERYVVNTNTFYGWAGPVFGYISDSGGETHVVTDDSEKGNTPTFPYLRKITDMGTYAYYRVVDKEKMGDGSGFSLDGEYIETNPDGSQSRKLKIKYYIPSEEELEGMPDGPHILDDFTLPTLPSKDSLEDTELFNLEYIDELLHSDNLTALQYVKLGTVFLGLAVLLYAVLLLLAYFFDRVNVFVSISLVRILTLGKVTLIDKSGKQSEKGTVSISKFIVIIVITFLLGSLLVSGLLFKWVFELVHLIMH